MTEIKSELMQAIDWIDDFIARCNGDDRGSCDSVNLVRARVAELESGEPVRPMSDEQIDAIPFTGFIPVSERGHSETEALRIFARLVEAHIK